MHAPWDHQSVPGAKELVGKGGNAAAFSSFATQSADAPSSSKEQNTQLINPSCPVGRSGLEPVLRSAPVLLPVSRPQRINPVLVRWFKSDEGGRRLLRIPLQDRQVQDLPCHRFC